MIVPLNVLPKKGKISCWSVLKIPFNLFRNNDKYKVEIRAKEDELKESQER